MLGPEVDLSAGKRHRIRKHLGGELEEGLADASVGHAQTGELGSARQKIEDEPLTALRNVGETAE